MKKALSLSLAVCFGAALGRWLDRFEAAAAPGAGQGGGVGNCAARNGDVNADGNVDVSDAVTILGHLFLGSPPDLVRLCAPPPTPSGLPDTGQSVCYDIVQVQVGQDWVQVPCQNAVIQGQDGSYATGCSSDFRFTDNGDGTVTDHCTGLMWQRETADVNGDGQSTDQDVLRWSEALAYCENLSFAGFDDWRLPSVRELHSIVDYGRFAAAIDPVFSVHLCGEWSSTSVASYLSMAWWVSFGDGGVFPGTKGNGCVRAVRTAL